MVNLAIAIAAYRQGYGIVFCRIVVAAVNRLLWLCRWFFYDSVHCAITMLQIPATLTGDKFVVIPHHLSDMEVTFELPCTERVLLISGDK